MDLSPTRYQVLILEDNPLDAVLAEQRLRQTAFDFDVVAVDCRARFLEEFESRRYDLILADYSLPDFDGLTALQIVRAKDERLPFIFVSGVLGEDVAVETMLHGATDYVVKQKLERLLPAVTRALTERTDYLRRAAAESSLREVEADLQTQTDRQAVLLSLMKQQRNSQSAEETLQEAADALLRHFDLWRVDFDDFSETSKRDKQQRRTSSKRKQKLDATLPPGYVSNSADFFRYETSADVNRSSYKTKSGANNGSSYLAIPVVRNGVLCAGVVLIYAQDRPWEAADIAFAEEIADSTWDSVDRQRAQSALVASEQRLSAAAQTANLGSWDLNLLTGKMDCSDICKLNYGRRIEEEFNYADLHACIHPDDHGFVNHAIQTAIANRSTYRAEYRVFGLDESIRWVIASGRATYDDSGTAVRMTGFSLDVTERHRAQLALLQNEKLAAVGRLAASIAHEINNPLESVTNLLYLARLSRDVKEIEGYLATAEIELRRVSAITNQTLRFYRQSSSPVAVGAENLLDGVLSIFQGRLLNCNIKVIKRLKARHEIECLDGEIRQVLSNLVGNAVDAMQAAGGSLWVRSRDVVNADGKPSVILTIADNGIGMPKQIRAKIFEAFYTTKGVGGTGLGLWVSKQIVDRHHGELRTRSAQGPMWRGTIFSLRLPCRAAKPDSTVVSTVLEPVAAE